MSFPTLEPTPEAALTVRPITPPRGFRSAVEIRHIVLFLNGALDEKLFARMERAPQQVSLAETLIALRRFHGARALAHPWNAKSVEDAVRAGDGKDYRLLVVRVLPNHVHVLLEAAPRWPTGDPIHRWKTASSPRRKGTPRPGLKRYGLDRLRPRALRLDQPRPDEFWADEDFEVILRTPEEVEEVRRLIAEIRTPPGPHAPEAPDDELDEPAAEIEPPPPTVSPPSDRGTRLSSTPPARRGALPFHRSSAPPARARGLRWWLDEIGQCAKDLTVLYGAFFLVVWIVWALKRALR